MKAILIAVLTALVTLLVACGTAAEEEGVTDNPTTESSSVDGLAGTSPSVGEIPTPVASSIEVTPFPTIASESVPTPSSLPPDTYSPTPEEIQVWEALTSDPREVGDKILAETDQFKITYLISNRQTIVTIKAAPYEAAKAAAEEWFVAQGLSPQALCVIVRINFVASQEVDDAGYEFKAEDTVPTGCDVPNW